MKAVKGLVVMNGELEEVFSCLNIGKVPASWLNTSYPSLKPLGNTYCSSFIHLLETLSLFSLKGYSFTFGRCSLIL